MPSYRQINPYSYAAANNIEENSVTFKFNFTTTLQQWPDTTPYKAIQVSILINYPGQFFGSKDLESVWQFKNANGMTKSHTDSWHRAVKQITWITRQCHFRHYNLQEPNSKHVTRFQVISNILWLTTSWYYHRVYRRIQAAPISLPYLPPNVNACAHKSWYPILFIFDGTFLAPLNLSMSYTNRLEWFDFMLVFKVLDDTEFADVSVRPDETENWLDARDAEYCPCTLENPCPCTFKSFGISIGELLHRNLSSFEACPSQLLRLKSSLFFPDFWWSFLFLNIFKNMFEFRLINELYLLVAIWQKGGLPTTMAPSVVLLSNDKQNDPKARWNLE